MNINQCLLTQNDCYKAGRSIVPKGVMVHSTVANNPRLSRYVAPDDGRLGTPSSLNWNQSGIAKCPHAFIGKLADGSVATYQVLPWTMRGWHCASGSKGSGNNTHISFEICEDGLTDASYFHMVYQEAVELTAYLCKQYGLNPLADGVVICHAEGHRRGIASNHADVLHWWPKHGKTMDDFRADVARTLKGEEVEDMPRYNTIAEIRESAGWAEATIRKMIQKGFLAGGGSKTDDDGLPVDMDLSMDMIRIMVMNDAAGVYGE